MSTVVGKLNGRVFTDMRECGQKGFLRSVGLNEDKSVRYFESILLKEMLPLFKKYQTVESIKDFVSSHEMNYSSKFSSKKVSKLSLDKFADETSRYFKHLMANEKDMDKLSFGYYREIEIDDQVIGVSADYSYMDGEVLNLVKVKRGKTYLSQSGRKIETSPNYDFDLFLLYHVASLEEKKTVRVRYHYIQEKGKKYPEMSDSFDEYKKSSGERVGNFKDTGDDVLKEIKTYLDVLKNGVLDYSCDMNKCKECPFKQVCYASKVPALKESPSGEKTRGSVRLTPEQESVIEFDKGFARVNAGAGSGKTTVLALRLVELILNGVDPKEILLITFTNKGAEEMKEKIAYWLEKEDLPVSYKDQMTITTFNGFGQKILEDKYNHFGFSQKPVIIQKSDKFEIIESLLDDHHDYLKGFNYENPYMDFFNAKGVIVKLSEIFDEYKSQNLKMDDMEDDQSRDIFSMYQRYNWRLKALNMIDYQDQINFLVDTIDKGDDILKTYGFRHIMIDEFQDSDPLQMKLIKHLITIDKDFKSLVVVGDDVQSIFSFRNADPKIITDFHKEFEDVKDIKLNRNFRSSKGIIKVANTLLKDKLKSDKRLVSDIQSPNEAVVKLEPSYNESIPRCVLSQISKCIDDGKELKDIAIITRTKSELSEIENVLKEKEIPANMVVNEPLVDHPMFKVVSGLASFFDKVDIDLEEQEDPSLAVLNYAFGLGINIVKSMSPFELKQYVVRLQGQMIESYRKNLSEGTEKDFFIELVSPLIEDERLEPLRDILLDPSFEDTQSLFDKLIRMDITQDDTPMKLLEGTYDAVTLTTAHSSKGKEYSIVIIVDEKFKTTLKKNTDIDRVMEEYRLLFVSVTRAIEELYIFTTGKTNSNWK